MGGSVSVLHFCNLLFNDLNIEKNELNHLVKYADNITILVKECNSNEQSCKDIIDQYFTWSTINQMPCNTAKCHEHMAQKKNKTDRVPVNGLKQGNTLKILGVTFQENNRFNEHVKQKLTKANKFLFVLYTLCQGGYICSQT